MTIKESRYQERQRQRRRQNRLYVASASLFLLGLVIGLAGSLYYAWLVAPADTPRATAADLSPSFQADYIQMVGQAYAADGNWPLAEARLKALADAQLPQTVLAQLEDGLRRGLPADVVRDLAQMAEQLGVQGEALAFFAPTAEATAEVTAVAQIASATPDLRPTALPEAAATPTVPPTLTPSPSPAPTATPQPDYRLLAQQQICQDTAVPQLGVTVVDALLQEMPGVEIVVSWDGGSDHFWTGFKPAEGAGYGDFEMQAGITYRVGIAGSGLEVGGLLAEPCATGRGWQAWQLRFQRLVRD